MICSGLKSSGGNGKRGRDMVKREEGRASECKMEEVVREKAELFESYVEVLPVFEFPWKGVANAHKIQNKVEQ